MKALQITRNVETALFVREDWTLFRTLATLSQKAGVAVPDLPQLVIKELVDNALDAGASCRFGRLPDGGFYVDDDGPGLPGSDEDVAGLFSIGRPLSSSKMIRLPTRGALGNGLRVVAGTVLASGGSLAVATRGRRLSLAPQDDGTTTVVAAAPWAGGGTRIEISFGPALQDYLSDALRWAKRAEILAAGRPGYSGRSSPWWYDSPAFFELLQAAGERTVRDLAGDLDGCSRRASEIGREFRGRTASSLSRDEADRLLAIARDAAPPVKAERLGRVGPLNGYGVHAHLDGQFSIAPERGQFGAEIPFVLEVWAEAAPSPAVAVHVNRTPITAEMDLRRDGQERLCYAIFGAGLRHRFNVGRKDYVLWINVTTPHIPLTSDGKEPDLTRVRDPLLVTLERAAKKAGRLARPGALQEERTSAKDVIVGVLDEAIDRASGGGVHRYSLRQLFYAVRPAFIEALGKEPEYTYFAQVIADHEGELGHDLPGIYRDERGLLYHPHTGEAIPLGTREVEEYERPPWTFNKILYCEKAGFFPVLQDARWPERHDCALLTSKGYASRAARDVLDRLGETGEPVTFFCIHDADGDGTLIYETLTQATRARGGRKVEIINLGLDPWEAVELGLPTEPITGRKQAVRVAGYVRERDPRWADWLQKQRVELNAFTTPQFLAWLDRKIAPYAGKVIPPEDVLVERLHGETKERLRQVIQERILRQAGHDRQVEVAFERLGEQFGVEAANLRDRLVAELAARPTDLWTAPIKRAAEKLAARRRRRS